MDSAYSTDEVRAILSTLVRALVDDEASVHVSVSESPTQGTVLDIEVADSDRGKVLGKRGRTVHALRVLFGVIAKQHGSKFVLNMRDLGKPEMLLSDIR